MSVYSESRLGGFDMGVDCKRNEGLRGALEFVWIAVNRRRVWMKSRLGEIDLYPRRTLAFLVYLCVAWGTPAVAENVNMLKVGDFMQSFALEDQFGDPQRVDENTTLVLFSRDMEGGELLSSALKNKPTGYLPERRVVYVADISRMPDLVARLFALPKMRKRVYPMLLDREGRATKRLPDQKNHGTLIKLDKLRVVNIEFLGRAGEIEANIEKHEKIEILKP